MVQIGLLCGKWSKTVACLSQVTRPDNVAIMLEALHFSSIFSHFFYKIIDCKNLTFYIQMEQFALLVRSLSFCDDSGYILGC
jgi:hypothetical protein